MVNISPRVGKSSLGAVCLCPFAWIHYPELQFLYASYAEKLSIRDNVKARRVLESSWYQARWGDVFHIVSDSNTKLRFDNDKTGYRLATSVDGTNTGEGGDIIVYDDPNSARDCSETILENTINWFDQTMASRLNDPKTGRRILIQQRLHEQDLTGHVLSREADDWVKLILPMEFEPARRCFTVPLPSTRGAPWTDPRTVEGELMWPERFGPKELATLKKGLGSEYVIAGQLQQRPAPAEGGLIKKHWFLWWKEPTPPKIDWVVSSWDTALSEKKDASYSACTVWGVFKNDQNVPNVILLNVWRGRLEYPELRRQIKQMSADWRNDDGQTPADGKHKPDMILIEAKGPSGQSLIQDLSRGDVFATPFDSGKFGDKLERVRRVTHLIEAGRVWVPARPPAYTHLRSYADFMVEQCATFPNAASRDLVDTMTQALLRLSISGWVWNSGDPGPPEPRDDRERRPFY